MPAKCCKDFMEKLPKDEPVFTVRARDILAAPIVAFWLQKARELGVNSDKLQCVQRHLDAIVDYQTKHPVKVPD